MVARPVTTTTFATGLDNPRGLAFGRDGVLYVAEGGRGGATSTVGKCRQIPAPIGPYSGGLTARISRIDRHGRRSTVADGLPSSQSSPRGGSSVSGVADVAFLGDDLYALVAGAGCSHGLEGTSNGIYRVGENGRVELVADLGAFLVAHPVAQPDPNDDEYDGTWYAMVAVEGSLYAVEPNHGEVDRVDRDGHVVRLVDISAGRGHIVPTAIAHRDGSFFVGNLGRFPLVTGASTILRIDPTGRIETFATGLTAVLGLAFDIAGRLYALQNSVVDEPSRPKPSTGRLVRLPREDAADRAAETIADGLMFPTGMAFGPDRALYVSTNGFGPPGGGTITRIEIAPEG